MAANKSRLGRGLDSLIAGGGARAKDSTSSKKTAPKAPSTAKKAAKTKRTTAPKAAPQAEAAPPKVETAPPPAPVVTKPAPKDPTEGFHEIKIGSVAVNPRQPRREFDDDSLAELADSIRSEGLLQPVVVRPLAGEGYELIAGERRLRACKKLGMKRIPARIVEASDASSAAISLIENLQRENLNPIEEAMGFASLLRDFDLTQEAVAERLGKSRPAITNALRLLTLADEIRGYIAKGLLSVGHAKVLLGLEEADQRQLLARRTIEERLSVRELEKLVQRGTSTQRRTSQERPMLAAEARAVEDIQSRLASHLSTKVSLKHGRRRGKIVIEYLGNDDLQRVLEKLGLED